MLCAAHCHSIYGRAMCTTGRTLDMLTQDFCCFYNDLVYYPYVLSFSLCSLLVKHRPC